MKIPVSKTYIKKQLLSHPDYPSLLSITDILTELRIENTAVQIEKDQLHEVNTPFLAHLNGNGGEFVIIKNRNNLDQQFPGFYDRWGGVIIAVEKPLNWSHKENSDWIKKDSKTTRTLLLTLSTLALFIFFSGIITFDWTKTGLMLIAAAGIFVSWMIVSKDLGIENKIAEQVCGKDADCNSVIHLSEKKLPFGIGWSDGGIIYFPFLLMGLLVTSSIGAGASIYQLLVLFATASMLLTIVSIYYQWKVIKKWCGLCLVTVALLWLQFIVLLPESINFLKYGFGKTTLIDIVQVSFILFITTTAWLWLKPMIKKNKKLESENFAAKRFKVNPDIFNALLEKQKKLHLNPDGLGIIIGNPAAENTIIKVCNPYCGPCAKAHPVIDKLLEENANLKVQILFTATDNENDIKAKPVRHLMALYEKNDKQLMQKALDDWYMADKKDYDAFASTHVLNGELENQAEKLKAMKAWCDEVKIEFTPTFFVNDYQLPKQYNIEELKYFL
jgi:protein-disulfide isomerase